MRILRRIFVPVLVLIMVCSISYAALLSESVYQKYTATLEWENSSLQSKIHMIPPGLAQNYVTGEEQRLLEIVADINSALEEIKENKGVTEDKYEEYLNLQDSIYNKIEANEENKKFLESNGLNDFNFYLEADSIVKNAYENFNVEDLEKLESTFASRILKGEQAVDKAFLQKIKTIAKDFRNLEAFSKRALEKLGAIENNVLNVNLKVDKEITEDLLEQIKEKDLRKFPHIDKLYGILTSESWTNILAHNEDSKNYFAWQESKKILESLSKSNYIPVSALVTVNAVLAHYPNVTLKEKDNHTIKGESQVQNVYYNGELLNENLYVKRGASLEFAIDYEYTENPKSIVTVEYLDTEGNILDVKVFEGYVGEGLSVSKDLPGYVLLETANIVDKFQEENSTVQLVYEKYVPPVIEEPIDIEEPVDDTEVESNIDEEETESEQ